MNTFISINDNFLNEVDFEKYSKFSKETNMWGERIPNVNWSGRVIFTENIEGFSQRNSLFLNNVKNIIKTKFEIEEEIYPDYLGVVKWEVGDMQHPHADGENENGEHPLHWRKFGCVLYLNDDYEGGEIYFPNQNIELKPAPNTLVFFPGSLEFLHGVKPITNGSRYTLTSFWTYDKKYSIRYDSNTEQHNNSDS